MTRSGVAVLLACFLAGCVSYCQQDDLLAKAATGDKASIDEVGEMGRPMVPSTSVHFPMLRFGFDAIKPNLDSPDRTIRLAAVEALRHLTQRGKEVYREDFPGIFDKPLSDPWREIRWRAAWALGRAGVSSPALRKAADDSDDLVAEAALRALGECFDGDAAPIIVRALDRSPDIRDVGIAALQQIFGKTWTDPGQWKTYVAEREKARARAGIAPADTAGVSS